MATTEVILREKVDGVGAEADVVKVKRGFARNFLLPQGKAFEATKANLRHIEELKKQRAIREAEELAEVALGAARKMNSRPLMQQAMVAGQQVEALRKQGKK